jgi:hypothetical protein
VNQPVALILRVEEPEEKGAQPRFSVELFAAYAGVGGVVTSKMHCRSFVACVKEFPKELHDMFPWLLKGDPLKRAASRLKFVITRVSFVPVRPHADVEWQRTLLLYRLLSIHRPGDSLRAPSSDDHDPAKPVSDAAISSLHHKYLNQSVEWLTKDASVAKTQKGFVYQEHLIMLLAYLAHVDTAHRDASFSIVGEANVAEAWNDVLFERNGVLLFFQQKHLSLYAATVSQEYSAKDVLATYVPPQSAAADDTDDASDSESDADDDGSKKKTKRKADACIGKYFHAYQRLSKDIVGSKAKLRRFAPLWNDGKVFFVFFTNRLLPLQRAPHLHLRGHPDVKLESVAPGDIPLHALSGFSEVVRLDGVYRFTALPATKIGVDVSQQAELNSFLQVFYLFMGQRSADELDAHCQSVIRAPAAGYSHAGIARCFSQFIHCWFVDENPDNHVLQREHIAEFFNNQEAFWRNLVRYSAYNDEALVHVRARCEKKVATLREVPCMQHLLKLSAAHSTVAVCCNEPLVALAAVLPLFSAGTRQVLTVMSPDYRMYTPTGAVQVVIAVLPPDELKSLAQRCATARPQVKLICLLAPSAPCDGAAQYVADALDQLKLIGLDSDVGALSLTARVSALAGVVSSAHTPFDDATNDTTEVDVSDWLLLLLQPLPDAISDREHNLYVEQELSDDGMHIPFERLRQNLIDSTLGC